MREQNQKSAVEPLRYRNDLINAEIGRLRLTNESVAASATEILRRKDPDRKPMAPKTVAAIRDGDPNLRLTTLAAVVEAVGLTLPGVFQPLEESVKAA